MALAVVRPGTDDAPAMLQSLMIDEVFAQATEDQALSFFVAIGKRVAASYGLPENGGLPKLEQAINRVWHELGLGQVVLGLGSDGIVIDHQGYAAGGTRSAAWPRAAAALLRGSYEAWFKSIGGPELHTRVVKQIGERIVLHHGL